MSDETAVVLYDGVCGFCNRSVQFVIKRDRRKRFRFAPLQSQVGTDLAAAHGIDATRLDGLILVEGDAAYSKSEAALRIARRLTWPWPIFFVFRIVPRTIRDWFYDQFAKRRYRWFGKLDACSIPTAADRNRFLVVD